MTELLTGRRWKTMLDEIIDHEKAVMGGFGAFERWVLMERAPERVHRLLAKGREHPNIINANSPFGSPVGNPAAAPSSFAPVASTNVETNLWVPAIWSPIPANDMQAGKVYQHYSGGVLGTSSAAPTSTWTPRVGQSATPASNISMGASTGTTFIASLAAVPWFSQFVFTIRALGLAASGVTATGNGYVVTGGLTTAAGIIQSIGSAVPTTVDSVAATGYILSQTWNNNQATNTVTAQMVTPVISLN
jgi:hypothetical protein